MAWAEIRRLTIARLARETGLRRRGQHVIGAAQRMVEGSCERRKYQRGARITSFNGAQETVRPIIAKRAVLFCFFFFFFFFFVFLMRCARCFMRLSALRRIRLRVSGVSAACRRDNSRYLRALTPADTNAAQLFGFRIGRQHIREVSFRSPRRAAPWAWPMRPQKMFPTSLRDIAAPEYLHSRSRIN